MGVQVPFVYSDWIAIYPEFTNLSEALVTNYFNGIVITLHRNDGGGPVSLAATQTTLLYAVLAHICYLFGGVDNPSGGVTPSSQIVGRISNASEGSVSVTTEWGASVRDSEAFWIQTKYGALYWTMTAPYRQMRNMPGRGPVPPGIPIGFGFRFPIW